MKLCGVFKQRRTTLLDAAIDMLTVLVRGRSYAVRHGKESSKKVHGIPVIREEREGTKNDTTFRITRIFTVFISFHSIRCYNVSTKCAISHNLKNHIPLIDT